MLPLGIQAGMTHFSLMLQSSPDIAHSQLKMDLKQQQIKSNHNIVKARGVLQDILK